MTTTAFCDSAGGIRALVRAHELTAATGGQLRLAVGESPVAGVLQLTGLDQVLPVYRDARQSLGSPFRHRPDSRPAPSTSAHSGRAGSEAGRSKGPVHRLPDAGRAPGEVPARPPAVLSHDPRITGQIDPARKEKSYSAVPRMGYAEHLLAKKARLSRLTWLAAGEPRRGVPVSDRDSPRITSRPIGHAAGTGAAASQGAAYRWVPLPAAPVP